MDYKINQFKRKAASTKRRIAEKNGNANAFQKMVDKNRKHNGLPPVYGKE